MTGKEVREILLKNGYVLTDVAQELGISVQAFNSRLNAKYFKDSYLDELEKILNFNFDTSKSHNCKECINKDNKILELTEENKNLLIEIGRLRGLLEANHIQHKQTG